MKALALLSFLALTLTGTVQAAAPGEAAPAFTLPDPSGKTHSLADFKGKYVVLEWLNHGCPFVKKHYDSGNMQKLQKKYTGEGVIWLSVCSSSQGKQGHNAAGEWAGINKEKNSAPTAVLLDSDGQVGKAYGAKTTPHMFVVSPEGKIIYAGAIDSIKSTEASDVQKATNYVSAALDSAMAGKKVETASAAPYGCSVKY